LITHDPLEAVRLGHSIYIMHGLPANIEKVFQLEGEIPRARDDIHVLKWQAELWKKLENINSIPS
jgi:putative hydroxymethylpyrimidine transport system ATP-binding protein